MYRDDSPDYSAPGASRRQRSPSYSPPRSRRNGDREYSSGSQRGSRRDNSNERRDNYGRRRSRSPQPKYMRRSRSRSNDRYNGDRYGNDRSPDRYHDTKPSVRHQRYPWEDEETLRSLHCKDCNVTLNDRDSMMGHLKGTQHLMQLRRLKDNAVRTATGGRGLNDVLVPNNDFDEGFWNREQGPMKLRPEQERFLDTKRYDAMPAKFNSRNYDHGQYKFDERENYCADCDVWVRSRDQMQAHKEGANHKKKSAKVHRYQCKLCLIEVPCQDTLDNHMRGKDHIKREKQLMEQRRQRGGGDNDDIEGYKTGPAEMAKLNNDEVEELKRLRKEVNVLRKKLKDYQEERIKCAKEHRTHELETLRKRAQFCLENHLHQAEMSRGGLYVKKEEPSDDVNMPSTSYNQTFKREPRAAKSERSEYMENENSDIILD